MQRSPMLGLGDPTVNKTVSRKMAACYSLPRKRQLQNFKVQVPDSEQNRALPQGAEIPAGGDRKSTDKQTAHQVAIRAIKKMREK